MVSSLVGYTGFVGSNLMEKNDFTYVYNSKNIEEAYGTNPDILVYAGVRAEKFLANQYPDKDLALVKEAFENIKKINPKQVVLISTIDVYKMPIGVNEDAHIDTEELHPYGLNRYYLEQWVKEEYKNSIIVRLPGLYGKNIKKNFIYDMIHVIPKMLNQKKFDELKKIDERIEKYYVLQENGFYQCKELKKEESEFLRDYFNQIGFSALNFTDSRGSFQFYNLSYLWEHISIALDNNIHLLNLATEPVTVGEIYQHIKQKRFTNEIANVIPSYDYKTKYDYIFGGKNGYIFSKEVILNDLKKFVEEYTK